MCIDLRCSSSSFRTIEKILICAIHSSFFIFTWNKENNQSEKIIVQTKGARKNARADLLTEIIRMTNESNSNDLQLSSTSEVETMFDCSFSSDWVSSSRFKSFVLNEVNENYYSMGISIDWIDWMIVELNNGDVRKRIVVDEFIYIILCHLLHQSNERI